MEEPSCNQQLPIIDRIISSTSILRISGRSNSSQTLILGLAGGFLVVGAIVSISAGAVDLSSIRWTYFVALCLTAPATIAMSALEYRLAAWTLSGRASWRRAVQVAVVGHTANYLPVPGGSLVRIGDLQASTSRPPRHAVAVTAAIGVAWLAAGCSSAAIALAIGSETLWAVLFGLLGVVSCVFTVWLVRSVAAPELRVVATGAAFAIEALTVLVAGLRIGIAMAALGFSIEPLAAFTMAAAGPLAAALGVVPGGLGVKEGLAGLLGRVAGLAALEGFAVSLLIRLVDGAIVGLAGLVVADFNSKS